MALVFLIEAMTTTVLPVPVDVVRLTCGHCVPTTAVLPYVTAAIAAAAGAADPTRRRMPTQPASPKRFRRQPPDRSIAVAFGAVCQPNRLLALADRCGATVV